MVHGAISGRNANMVNATTEAKRVLSQTQDWQQTKNHMKVWLVMKYSLSRPTVSDYLNSIRIRLLSDPDLARHMGDEAL